MCNRGSKSHFRVIMCHALYLHTQKPSVTEYLMDHAGSWCDEHLVNLLQEIAWGELTISTKSHHEISSIHSKMALSCEKSSSIICIDATQSFCFNAKCKMQAWTIETRQDGSMLSCFYPKFWPYHLNVAAEIETHQNRQRFSNLLLSSFGDPVWIVASVLSWPERHPVWSSAAGAHLLQGSTCCAFRDGILHTLVVTSGYLSYCCLSIISNQSAHSPLTSTRHFHPHNCCSLDIFSFSDHSL